MPFDKDRILAVLDRCCDAYTFPMLDNGYVYLAATRLSLYRSAMDWALVIEVFGFSPRSGLPDTHLHTFASRLHDRDPPDRYVNRQAYDAYLANNPHNESRFVYPVDEGLWQDADDDEVVSAAAKEVVVRGEAIVLPRPDEYKARGIPLEEPPKVQVFELCRFLADSLRDRVLATPQERRISVPPGLTQLLQLEEWHHPDVLGDESPSSSETFQRLAEVLVTGDVSMYRPSRSSNTHWRNWPDGGRL